MLGEQEIRELITRAQAGDSQAKDVLVQSNFNLVRSVVHRFTNRGYEWDDLFQIGCIGLVKAIERFDTRFEVRLSTYAVPMIIGEIRRFMRDDNPIKVSRQVRELAYQIHRIQEKLQGTLGREPTVTEVSKELALAPQEVVAALEAVQPPTSLYEQTFHDDADSPLLLDQIKCNDGQDAAYYEKLALEEVISRLPAKEQRVIRLRFFEDKTQSEIAQIIGLSQVQVSRIEKHALKMIREILQNS